MANDTIQAVAALVRARDVADSFDLAVRWTLGDGESDKLPSADDVFTVVVEETDRDGAVLRELARADVAPHLYFMLDPQRETGPWPYPVSGTWSVAQRPKRAVDPDDSKDADLSGKPFGVVHLLRETHRARVAWRVKRRLAQAMQSLAGVQAAAAVVARLDDPAFVDSLCERFAVWLVGGEHRAEHVPRLLRTTATLLGQPQEKAAQVTPLPMDLWSTAPQDKGAPVAGTPAQKALELAVLARALAQPDVMADVGRLKTESEQVRRHLRLRMLHGGCLIDYWSDPDGSGTADPALRGRPMPGSHVLGLGTRWRLGQDDIQAMHDAKNGLRVTVAQAKAALPAPDAVGPGMLDAAGGVEHFGDATVSLDYTSLKHALAGGTSCPVAPPTGARIDYDLFQSPPVMGQTRERTQFGFRTGDGRVEIVIDPLPEGASAIAFNVYGMWEGHPAAAPYFQDPLRVPDRDELEQLKPWLMSRRYSPAKDLGIALSDDTGAPLPGLDAELAAPCWQPVLPRPDQTLDITDSRQLEAPLPNRGKEKTAVFAYDLRKGFFDPGAGPVPSWDPSVPPDSSWTADRWRPGTRAPGKPAPQRYRFFVTAVDLLDQESAPLAVSAEDRDAGQAPTFLFAARQRSALAGPPGSSGGAVFGLAYAPSPTDPLAGTLTLDFETPYRMSAAADTANGAAPREDKARLVARATILRRRPKRPLVAEARVAPGAFSADSPWKGELAKLEQEGWQSWHTATVAAPRAGDRWETQVAVGDTDLGYEYIAAVGFELAPAFRQLWADDLVGTRIVQLCELVNGQYTFRPEHVDEIVSVSPLSTTPVCAIRDERPNQPAVVEPAVGALAAIPVPAPPGLDRDLVLQRIVTADFTQDGIVLVPPADPEAEWAGLTEGQVVMCRNVLRRTIRDGRALDGDEDELALARRLLALDTRRRPVGPRHAAQHPTIGFRGLARLRWEYQAQAELPPGERRKYAETSAFRIYQARIALDTGHALGSAAASGSAERRPDGRFTLGFTQSPTLPEAVKALIGSTIPGFVRLHDGNGVALALIAGATAGSGDAQVVCTLQHIAGRPLPSSASASVHLAQPLALVETRLAAPGGAYEALLPLGGGPAELFAWCVRAVSFQATETVSDAAAVGVLSLDGSIQPDPPSLFRVEPPTRAAEHVLDRVAAFRNFLPARVEDAEDARQLPRLVVQWSADDAAPDVFMALERIEEQVRTGPGTALKTPAAESPWQAISRIAGLPEGEPIELEWLRAIQDNWLMGKVVDVDGLVKPVFHILDPGAGPARRVTQRDGLVQVSAPSDPPGAPAWPTFIDYFGRNGDLRKEMDGNWQFQYRLTPYRDLKNGLPDEWRYLYARPSAWSAFAIPETPQINLTRHPERVDPSPALDRPLVRFVFRTADGSDSGALRWRYRAILRRKLEVPMASTGGAPREVWVDVGVPLTVLPDGKPATVEDGNLDREWPNQAARIHYRVFVQQFRQDLESGSDTEVLVRSYDLQQPHAGHDGFTVELPAPEDPAGAEIAAVVEFDIS